MLASRFATRCTFAVATMLALGCSPGGVPVVIDTRAVGQATALTAELGGAMLKTARVRENLWIAMGAKCGEERQSLTVLATGSSPSRFVFDSLDVCGKSGRIRLHLMSDGTVTRHVDDAPEASPSVN